MTIEYITGFEHGINPSVNGGGLADTIVGSPTVQGTVKRSGNYALQVQTTSSVNAYIQKTLPSTAVKTIQMYVRFDAAPTNGVMIGRIGGSITTLYFGWNLSGQENKLFIYGTSSNVYSQTLSLDTWYRVDITIDGTNKTVDWKVEGTDCTQGTFSTAGTMNYIRIGSLDPITSGTVNTYYDDIIISDASGDYPFGGAKVIGITPNADGTHNNTNEIQTYLSDPIDGSSVFAWNLLDELPWTSTGGDYVKQVGADSSKYVEVQFADLSDADTVIGAMCILKYMSNGTTANSAGTVVRDGNGQETTVWGNGSTGADYSETSAFFKSVIIATPSGGWSQTAVNALRARMGYASSIASIPWWPSIITEVGYLVSTSASLTVNDSAHTNTSENTLLAQVHAILINNSQHINTSENILLIQVHNILINNSQHINTSENIVFSLPQSLEINNCSHIMTELDYLAFISFESGDFSEINVISDPSEDMSITSESAQAGSVYGLSCDINVSQNHYLDKFLSSSSGYARVRFYLDTNNIYLPSATQEILMILQNGSGGAIGIAALNGSAFGYSISAYAYDNAQVTKSCSPNYNFSDGILCIEVLLVRGTSGYMQYWVNDVLIGSSVTFDNTTRFADLAKIRIGQPSHTGSSQTGTYYLDEYVITDTADFIGSKSYPVITLTQEHNITTSDDAHTNISENISTSQVITAFLNPISDISLGSWLDQSDGSTNIYQSIDEDSPNDSDYIKSPNLPSANTYKFKLEEGVDPSVDYGHYVYVRISKPAGSATVYLQTRLLQGVSTIKQWQDSVTESFTTIQHALTEAEVSQITDYSDLYIELEAVES